MAVLRERFDVSLSVVREALTRLSEQRLVRSVSQLGFTVVPLSVADLIDLTSVRIDVESLVVRRAVANGDAGWEAALADSLDELEAASAGGRPAVETGSRETGSREDDYREAHERFHATLATACPSPRLREIRARLFDAAELYRHWQVPEQRAVPATAATGVRGATGVSGVTRSAVLPATDLHAAICQAALRRDADTAVELIATHIQAAADRLLRGATAI